jgi:hypothetical protein
MKKSSCWEPMMFGDIHPGRVLWSTEWLKTRSATAERKVALVRLQVI